jgi:hypothetical protein
MKAYYAALAIVTVSVLTAVPSLAAPTGSTAHRSATENLATPAGCPRIRGAHRGNLNGSRVCSLHALL